MSDDLRDRWKSVNRSSEKKSDDLFSAWEEQKKMQAEDKKIEQDIKDAKKKARELKKELYKNKFGDSSSKFKEVLENATKNIKQYSAKAYTWSLANKKYSLPAVALFVGITGWLVFGGGSSNPQTLGENTKIFIDQDLPRETPDFDLLYKAGTTSEQYDVVKISPPGNDPSYTYLDRFSEASPIIKVTQQEVPQKFNLEEAATNFNATNVIQIDGEKIYHGFNEKVNVQSLIFIKDEKLISISSPQRFSDDQWVAYITALK